MFQNNLQQIILNKVIRIFLIFNIKKLKVKVKYRIKLQKIKANKSNNN